MAIYTASQATTAVNTYSQQQSASLLADTIARYQYVFDSIAATASTGGLQLVTKFSKNDYTQLAPVLLANGYSITSLPSDDVSLSDTAVTYEVTITWPLTAGTTTALLGVIPTQFTALKDLAYAVTFTPVGGVGPYTFSYTGSLPTGMTLGTQVNVSTLTLSGTPTGLSEGVIQLIATDALGSSQTTTINWLVNQYVPPVPTSLSQLTNDAGYATVPQTQSLIDQLDNQLATVAKTGSYYNLSNIPDLTQKLDVTNGSAFNANFNGAAFSGAVTGLDKSMVGLDQVDNTSDLDKPISTATSTALDSKADLYSPSFSGLARTSYVISDQRAVLVNTSIVNNTLIVGTLQSGTLQAGMVLNGSGIPSPQTIAVTTAYAFNGFATVTFYTQAKVPFAQGQTVTLIGLTGLAAILNGDHTVYDATVSQFRFSSPETISPAQVTTGTVNSTQSVTLQAQLVNGNWYLNPYQQSGQALSAPATTITATPNPQLFATKDYVDRKFFFHLAGGIW